MHYELFKYLNPNDLLQIRSLKLGGYQLTSNELLRSRINNYLLGITQKINIELELSKIERLGKQTRLLFEQSGRNCLQVYGNNLNYPVRKNPLNRLFNLLPTLNEIVIGNYYLFIN